jgi:hypothetical protein
VFLKVDLSPCATGVTENVENCQIYGLLNNKDIDTVLLHFKHIFMGFITFRRYCRGRSDRL